MAAAGKREFLNIIYGEHIIKHLQDGQLALLDIIGFDEDGDSEITGKDFPQLHSSVCNYESEFYRERPLYVAFRNPGIANLSCWIGYYQTYEDFVHYIAESPFMDQGMECKLFTNKLFAAKWSNILDSHGNDSDEEDDSDYDSDVTSRSAKTASKHDPEPKAEGVREDIPEWYKHIYIVFGEINNESRSLHTWSAYEFSRRMDEFVKLMGDKIWYIANFTDKDAATKLAEQNDFGTYSCPGFDVWDNAVSELKRKAISESSLSKSIAHL